LEGRSATAIKTAKQKEARVNEIDAQLANSLSPEDMARAPGDPNIRERWLEVQGNKPYLAPKQREALEAARELLAFEAKRSRASAPFARLDDDDLIEHIEELEARQDSLLKFERKLMQEEFNKLDHTTRKLIAENDLSSVRGEAWQLAKNLQALQQAKPDLPDQIENARAERQLRAMDVESNRYFEQKVNQVVAARYAKEDQTRIAKARRGGDEWTIVKAIADSKKSLEQRTDYAARKTEAVQAVRMEQGARLANGSKIARFREANNARDVQDG
jgi:hypothetical protein